MFKYILLGSIIFCVPISAQHGKMIVKNSKSRSGANNQKSSSNLSVSKINLEKGKLIQLQKNIRIEIINSGDWKKYNQTLWLRIVKVNDGDLSQILGTDNNQLQLSENAMGTNNWQDENGNFSFRSISEPLKISQEFTGLKNDKGQSRNAITENEVYETTAPIYSFSLKIDTHPKASELNPSKDFTKVINIYSNNELVKSFNYSYNEIIKLGGITIKDLNVKNIK